MQMDHYTISFTILFFYKINVSGSDSLLVSTKIWTKVTLGRLPSFGQFTSFRNFISDVVNFILTPCWIKSYLPQAASDTDIGESCWKTTKSRTPYAKIFDDEWLIVWYLPIRTMYIHVMKLKYVVSLSRLVFQIHKQYCKPYDLWGMSHTKWLI